MSKITREELDEMLYVDGYGKMSVFYTGGGIYCGYAEVSGMWVIFNDDDFLIYVDSDPRKTELAFDSNWQNEHLVYEPETDKELNELLYGIFNTFIDLYDSNDYDLIDYNNCNLSLSEVKDIVERLGDILGSVEEDEPKNTPYQVVDSIEVGGPIDAYVDYFWELANRDRCYRSDCNETPIHAGERAIDMGNIAKRLFDRENNETETEFFVTIFRDSDNDPYWLITDTFKDISRESESKSYLGDIDIIYRISGDIYEPDLDIVKDANRTEYLDHYCATSDMTFITKVTYKNGIKVTEEITGFYHGTPDECNTTFFKNSNVATYQF